MTALKRIERATLKKAHKSGPLSEADLGDQLVTAMQLIARGYMTAGPQGFSITSDGARAIGKRMRKVDVGAMAAAGLEELVEPAIALVQRHREATGDEAEDKSTGITLLLTLCVAVGILARIVEIDSRECMRAINVGRKVKISDHPL